MIKTAVTAFLAIHLLMQPLRAHPSSSPTDLPRCTEDPEVLLPNKMNRPRYLNDALSVGKGGKVELRAVITPEGKTKELVVLGGDPEFSNSALAAIRKWRFRPVSIEGRPVETTYNVHVSFHPLLQEANSDVALESPRREATLVLPANLPDSADGTIYKSYEPGVVSPKPIYSPEPEFTERARKAQDQGMVTLYVPVGLDGRPQDVRAVCGPAPDLTEQAIESLKLWKFSPGCNDGKAVSVAVLLEVRFELH